jgi:nucleoside phosphorylase
MISPVTGRYGKTIVGVVTVIDEEFSSAQRALEASKRHPKSRYFHGADGPGRFVLAQLADRGNVAASEGVAKLIEHWRPAIVLISGIAGGIEADDGPMLGDLVVPDYIHYADFRKITEAGDRLRYAAYDQPTVSIRDEHVAGLIVEGKWSARIEQLRPEVQEAIEDAGEAPLAHVGAIVATEKILSDPDHPEQERIFVTFDHAVAVDMESYGVARAVHGARTDVDYNPRLCIVRGISDIVRRHKGEEEEGRIGGPGVKVQINNEERSLWKAYAADVAAAFAAEFVAEVCS